MKIRLTILFILIIGAIEALASCDFGLLSSEARNDLYKTRIHDLSEPHFEFYGIERDGEIVAHVQVDDSGITATYRVTTLGYERSESIMAALAFFIKIKKDPRHSQFVVDFNAGNRLGEIANAFLQQEPPDLPNLVVSAPKLPPIKPTIEGTLIEKLRNKGIVPERLRLSQRTVFADFELHHYFHLFYGKNFVGYVKVEDLTTHSLHGPQFHGRGLGFLNYLIAFRALPLPAMSSKYISDDATSVWKKLARAGFAVTKPTTNGFAFQSDREEAIRFFEDQVQSLPFIVPNDVER